MTVAKDGDNKMAHRERIFRDETAKKVVTTRWPLLEAKKATVTTTWDPLWILGRFAGGHLFVTLPHVRIKKQIIKKTIGQFGLAPTQIKQTI